MAHHHDRHRTHVHHADEVISSHRTSEGVVRYLRCSCGAVVLETGAGRRHMGGPAGTGELTTSAA